MAKPILTGVDNSETALRAAERAATLAVAFGVELHVLSSFTVNMTESVRQAQPDASDKIATQYADNAGRIASTAVEALRINFPKLVIISKSREGAPAFALLREAQEIDADIIVVGNKRVQGLARFLGSIARTIASEADCDLYVVNTHQR